MTVKLFVTDFDGTLLRDDKTISSRDLNTLEKLRQKNIFTAIATGRSAFSFERAIHAMGWDAPLKSLPVDYLIFSTGAGVMALATGKILLKREIRADELKTITDCFDEHKLDYMVHQAIPDTRYFLYKSHGLGNSDFQSRMALYPSCAAPLSDGFTHDKDATEVLAIVPPQRMDKKLIPEIQAVLKGFSVIQATSPIDHSSVWIEVFHEKVSKSRTTAWLSDYLGVAQGQVVSVGNDYNDQDLLAWSGQGFVVKNAPEDLKRAFKTVHSNNMDGVSQAVMMASLLGG